MSTQVPTFGIIVAIVFAWWMISGSLDRVAKAVNETARIGKMNYRLQAQRALWPEH
jgi:hypothetical protein